MRLLPLALLLCLPGTAAAQPLLFNVTLTGDEEAPPVVTPGSGQAAVTLDPGTGAVTVDGVYSNLGSPAVDAHIHGAAPRGRATGVILPLMQSGGTQGTFGGAGMLTAQQVQDMLSGLTYLNVHTSGNQGGEIRGQIDAVTGSGSLRAPSVIVTGAAIPGGTLQVSCPPGTGTDFIAVGLALPPGQTVPLAIPELCAPVPVGLAIDLNGPLIAFPGSSVNLQFPVPFPSVDLAVHCVRIALANCIVLSGAHRVAVRQ